MKQRYDGELEKDNDFVSGIVEAYTKGYEDNVDDYGCSLEDDQWTCKEIPPKTEKSIPSDDVVPPACEPEDNTKCTGYVKKFKTSKNIDNVDNCCEKCRNDIFCVAWSYKKKNSKCIGYYDKKECVENSKFQGGAFI